MMNAQQAKRKPRALRTLPRLTLAELEAEHVDAYAQLRVWAHRLNYVTALRHPEWSAQHVNAETLRAVDTLYEYGGGGHAR